MGLPPRGRRVPVVVTGSEYPAGLALLRAVHAGRRTVAVVSTPDEKWGERPKAFVELAEGEDASEEDILEFAKEHLTGYMRPSAVEITKLPKTSTGKIQKKELRDTEWEGHERRIG